MDGQQPLPPHPAVGSYPDNCTFSYDVKGYISESTWTENPDHEYSGKCIYTITNGSLTQWSNNKENYKVRNNPERPNNLNIDLFGVDEFTNENPFNHIYLFGAGGCRFRTLPLRIDYGEDGAETYRYEMEGDYISKIEISDEDGELNTRLEIFYE